MPIVHVYIVRNLSKIARPEIWAKISQTNIYCQVMKIMDP